MCSILREPDQEESVDLIFYGGVHTGTDMAFHSEMDSQARQQAAMFITSMVSEGSMMARCSGKTNIVNLEPEDLRAYTVATSRATSISLPGRNVIPT